MKKIIVYIAIVVAVLGIAIAGFLEYAKQRDYFYADIEKYVSAETGYIVEKSTLSEFDLLPVPTLTYNQVVVTNLADAKNPRLGEVENLLFKLKFLPLLRGQFVVDLEIISLDANLHIYDDERNNWMTEELRLITAGLPFEVDKVLASNTHIQLSDHRYSDEFEFQLPQIDLDFETKLSYVEIQSAGQLAGAAFEVDGELQYSHDDALLGVDLELAAGKYSANPKDEGKAKLVSEQISDDLVDLPITGRVSGSLRFESGLPRGMLAVEASAKKLDNLMQFFPAEPATAYNVGPLEGKARIQLNGPDLDADEIHIRMQHEKLNFLIEGSAYNLLSNVEFSASVSAGAQSLGDIPGFLALVPADLQPEIALFDAGADMMISGNLEEFSVEDMKLEFSGDSITLAMSGGLLQLPNAPHANLNLHLMSDQSVDMEKFLSGMEGLRLPAPVDINGTVSIDANSAQIEELQVQAGNHTNLFVSGVLLRLQEDPSANLDLRLMSDRPMNLDEYLSDLEGLRLPAPVAISGVFSVDKNHVLVEDFQARVGGSDLQGSIQAKFGATPYSISADLQSRNYLTSIFQFEPDSSAADSVPNDSSNQTTQELEPVLTEEEIGERFRAYTSNIIPNTEPLKDLHLDIALAAQAGKFGSYEFDNFNADIEIKNGILEIQRITTSTNSGSLEVEGSIDTNSAPPAYRYSAKLDELELELFFELEDDVITGGRLSGELSLSTEGETLSEMLENMSGESLITVGPVAIKSKLLDQVSTDFLATILGGIINKESKDKSSAYQCGVFGAEIENGVVRTKRTVALQANDYILVGKGNLDLNTGYMNFAVVPRARRGLGLSVSSIVGGFRIKGNLATPKYQLNTSGIFSNAVLGWALMTPTVATLAPAEPVTATIVATGIVVKGFFHRITASNYKCENIIKRIERLRSNSDMDDHSRTRKDF